MYRSVSICVAGCCWLRRQTFYAGSFRISKRTDVSPLWHFYFALKLYWPVKDQELRHQAVAFLANLARITVNWHLLALSFMCIWFMQRNGGVSVTVRNNWHLHNIKATADGSPVNMITAPVCTYHISCAAHWSCAGVPSCLNLRSDTCRHQL